MYGLKMKKITTPDPITSWLRFWLLGSLLWLASPAFAVPLLSEIRYSPLQSGDTEVAFVFDEKLSAMPQLQVQNSPGPGLM